ncbi:MAG TPA: hypothetical protein VGO13_07100 [Solirubrobacterales bacterium]|jgi:hypothetical protein|nr:hypothetical protein [Solirubrobacterales bacterium]
MALTLVALALTVGACGSAADGGGAGEPSAAPARAVGHGSKTRDCDVVFIGPGPADWRKNTDWVGSFGISRRSFSQGAYETDGSLYRIKTPMVVAGHRPVTISVPGDELDRVGILGVHPKPSYVSVTYVPCPDKPRTVFAAGFELRDKRPFRLLVEIAGGPARELVVGRPAGP